ncbi:hypothetical protein AB0J72_48830 [Dactylosporangium sp. NPDC049742]|uniref:hypothetical protein n=1 Tax=Dactylosporangium sp. NPDC049742 TaxID=3154737 RepID=UPI0034463714
MRTRLLARAVLPLLLAAFAGACSKAGSDDGVATVDGTSRPSTTATGSLQEQAIAYTRCMREHGVPLSDPEVSASSIRMGPVDKAAVGNDKLMAAEAACAPLLPQLPPAEAAAKVEKSREFSRCMRAHGFPDFPDPEADGHIADVPLAIRDDPRYIPAKQLCDDHVRSYTPSPAVTR